MTTIGSETKTEPTMTLVQMTERHQGTGTQKNIAITYILNPIRPNTTTTTSNRTVHSDRRQSQIVLSVQKFIMCRKVDCIIISVSITKEGRREKNTHGLFVFNVAWIRLACVAKRKEMHRWRGNKVNGSNLARPVHKCLNLNKKSKWMCVCVCYCGCFRFRSHSQCRSP